MFGKINCPEISCCWSINNIWYVVVGILINDVCFKMSATAWDEIRNRLVCNLSDCLIRSQYTCRDIRAESHNTGTTTQEIEKTIKDVINNIINYIEYEIMETEPSIFDDFRGQPITVADLAALLYYATQCAEGGDSSDILQLDDESPALDRLKGSKTTWSLCRWCRRRWRSLY